MVNGFISSMKVSAHLLECSVELARQSRNSGFGLSWEESPGSIG